MNNVRHYTAVNIDVSVKGIMTERIKKWLDEDRNFENVRPVNFDGNTYFIGYPDDVTKEEMLVLIKSEDKYRRYMERRGLVPETIK